MARSNNFQVRVTGDTTKFDAAMSKATRELQSFGNAAKSAFAVVGVTSFAAALGSLAKTIGDFERANSELAAVLGTNLKGVEDLTKSAKELGRQSEFTASDVTKLQIALSRLGFDSSQIKEMQKSILDFALAMGTDLSSAADFTGAALRAFGLQASDTTEILDVMAAATTNSALDFGKLQSSLSTVAPIAKAFGLDAKETAAFLGVLSNNGFDASSAATALRNILLNLSDSNGKLATGIGHSARSFEEIISAFKELEEKGVDVNAVLKMTDQRSAAAATTIITQADAVLSLKEKLDDADGSLRQMADTMNDNLVGATRGLKSAWEGFVLALEDSKGPMKDAVNRLTDILNRMTDIISGAQDVTWYEALLGPITGGLIASRQAKKREGAGGAGYSGGGSGGGSREETVNPNQNTNTPPDPPEPTPAQLAAWEKLRKEKEKIAEIQEKWASMKDSLGALAEVSAPAFAGLQTPTLNILPQAKDVELFRETFLAQLGDITVGIGFEADTQKIFDITNEVTAMANDMATSIGEAMGNLFADLISGENAWGNFSNAALSAFGDMAISVGKIAIEMGIASDGIKAALKLDNPYVAIAAGIALVALGTAVKSSLSSVASGDYGTGSVASGSYSSGASSDFTQRDVYVNVTGTLVADGDQLKAVINNVDKKDHLTT